MSTENEGAAVTPAAGPNPTPPAADEAPSAGASTRAEDEDFSLASPDASDAAPADAAPSDKAPASAPAPAPAPAPTATERAPEPTQPSPPTQPPQSAQSAQPTQPSQPSQPQGGADLSKHSAEPPPPPASGGGWGYGASGAAGGAGTPPPPPPYGGGPAGPGGPVGPGGPGTPPPHDPWAMPSAPVPAPNGGGRRGGLVAAIVVAALVAGGVGGGLGFWAADRSSNGDSTTISSSADPKTLNRSPKSVAGIAAKALPSVVTIQSSGGGEEGTGTGFVYDKEGHILTNNHVVANGARGGQLKATFSDGKKYDAEVVGEAQGYDIAVLKLKGADDRKLTPIPLADSKDVEVGDATIAIGAPYGLSGTVTTGIVSAKNRPVASSDGQGASSSYMSALQTDASINPGNSGGPLLNAQGAVVGVNSAIQPGGGGDGMGGGGGQGGSVGLGFAIPVNQAKRVAGQLIKTGQPVYPVIGATVETGGGNGNGATISRTGQSEGEPAVTPDGPADKAGLKAGDVITKLNDTAIDSGQTLIGTIWTHKPGEKVKITYERDGKERTTDVTLGSRKGDQ
ncbi:hypothetical protein GCM10009801_08680 [Streptomyces albiaxialis]|uniref:PDZ domain-containing protein n=1 Tax=Streptomyces albiaxialis TaxID=329523 RepID=A0ABN2VLX9_9ACTN